MFRGSDSLTICFNAVAILFVLEIDNMLYSTFVPESTKAHAWDGQYIRGGADAFMPEYPIIHTVLLENTRIIIGIIGGNPCFVEKCTPVFTIPGAR